MRSFGTSTLRVAACFAAALAVAPSSAHADDLALTLMHPGAGFLVTDGQSKVELEILVRDEDGPITIKRASVEVERGKVMSNRVTGPGRVSFIYAVPDSSSAVTEDVQLQLRSSDGNDLYVGLSFEVPAPRQTEMLLSVDPSEQDVESTGPVDVRAVARGKGLDALTIVSSHGELSDNESPERLSAEHDLELPESLPPDAPSHFMVLSAAGGPGGFAASQRGISIIAPIRVSVEVPRRSQLHLTGTETEVPPVRAPADGRTVIEGRARYGAEIRAFWQRRRRKKEIPIVVSAGLVPVAIASAIPGQDIADGGTGASIVLGIPPPAFGGAPQWPMIELEGAQLVDTIDLADDLKALIVERPKEPGPVTLILDGMPLEPIQFRGTYGRSLELTEGFAEAGERGALELNVRDAFGNPTDAPKPRVRIEDTTVEPELIPTGIGRYRVVIPTKTPGDEGDEITVIGELPAPRVLVGDPPELAQTQSTLTLEGPAPAIAANLGPVVRTKPSVSGINVALAVSAQALAGTTFGSQLLFGGAIAVEVRLPVWNERIGLRSGAEFYRGSGAGRLTFWDNQEGRILDSTTALGGVVIPIEAGLSVVQTSAFELTLRAGGEVRFDTASLTVEETSAGGGDQTAFSARTTAEAGFSAGPGDFSIGVTLNGVGASTNGMSNAGVEFEGSLMNIRLDLGYRIWL